MSKPVRGKERQIDLDPTLYAVKSLSLLNVSRREETSHCDFTIKVGNQVIPVHKNLLSVRSKYFEALFRAETTESKTNCVVLKDVDEDCVVKCIDYIYTGKASISDWKIVNFLHVAHMLQIQGLCDGIVKMLKGDLNSKSFFETKRNSDMYDLEDLQKTCDEFAKKNFETISQEEAFKELEKEYFVFLLDSPDTIGAEYIKFDALLKWINGKPAERNSLFPNMLDSIKLSKLPPRYYHRLLQNEPLVYESASIQRKFTLAMMKTEVVRDDSLMLYDTSTQYFYAYRPTSFDKSGTKLMESPEKRGNSKFAVVHCEATVYLLSSSGALYSIELDDAGAKWRALDRTKQTYNPPHAVVLDGSIYVFGSEGGLKYDISANRWSSVPQRKVAHPTPPAFGQQQFRAPNKTITDSSVAAGIGKIYIIGGRIADFVFGSFGSNNATQIHGLGSVRTYDPTHGNWSDCANLNDPRYNAGVAVKKERLYVIGGSYSEKTPLKSVEYYDLLPPLWSPPQRWTTLRDVINALSPVSACVVGGKIYIVGSGSSSQTTVQEFDTDNNVLTPTKFGQARQWSSAVAVCVKTLV